MIDFHSHILPGVDHGSNSVETSLAMLQQASRAGVTAIVATPHYYAHEQSVDSFLARREEGYQRLMQAVQGSEWEKMALFYGAEVSLEESLLKRGKIDRLTIHGTNLLLLEMPFDRMWQSWMYDAIYDMERNYGVSVVIAHVDRYPQEDVKRLLDTGVTAQVNASALVHGLSQRRLRTLCAQGSIQLLGSDAHDSKHRNYKDMALVQRRLDPGLLASFYRNAEELLLAKTALC